MKSSKLPRLFVGFVALSLSASVLASEYGEPKDAEAMVKKAVVALKANKAKTLDEINSGDAKWKELDVYVQVFSLEGILMAHGTNPTMKGKLTIDLKDPKGKPFVREQIELGKTKPSFWYDYSYTDPVSKKVLPKTTYCERLEDFLVCSGVYKR